MIKHTFLDKCSSIISGIDANTGNNPVIELEYGKSCSRALIHFDRKEILKHMEEDGKTPSEVKHVLKMTNCSSVNNDMPNDTLVSFKGSPAKRASSFDLILFKVPFEWDRGVGYSEMYDFWAKNSEGKSTDGCTWYSYKTGKKWVDNNTYETKLYDNGIYSSMRLKEMYRMFAGGEDSPIIGEQHFEIGNEDLEIDITDYVNSDVDNFGLCIAFAPSFEMMTGDEINTVRFFSNRTNTFFHPYVETTYDDYIDDDSTNIVIGRENKIYLTPFIDGEPVDADKVGCSIELETGTKILEANKVRKGVYCAKLGLKQSDVINDTILYDKWLIKPKNSENEEVIEGEGFNVFKKDIISLHPREINNVVPFINYTHDGTRLMRGEILDVEVQYRKKYEFYKPIVPPKKAYYRIYTKNAGKEITVFDYQPIDRLGFYGMITLDTSNFVSGNYFMDIMIENNRTTYFNNILNFDVVDDDTHKFI